MTLRGIQQELRDKRPQLVEGLRNLIGRKLPYDTCVLVIGDPDDMPLFVDADGDQLTVNFDGDSKRIKATDKTAEALADEIIAAGVQLVEDMIG